MAKNLTGKFEQKNDEPLPIFHQCYFSSDGRCRYENDLRNKNAAPIGATVRINDYWICNWHWENGYDAQLRTGEIIPKLELKRRQRLKEINEYVEKYQSNHPGASKKDASFAYMREHGLLQTLAAAAPQLMQDPEALTEREAIQTEGA